MEYKIQVRDLERNKRNQKEEEKLRNRKKAYTALHVTLAIYITLQPKSLPQLFILNCCPI